jgi:metal-responsive CopG/Arc/MetJ family transcriptional regulator
MQSSIAVGISLPANIIKKIDTDRGDVSRSRYVLRIIEKTYIVNNQNHEGIRSGCVKNNNNSLDNRFGRESSSP